MPWDDPSYNNTYEVYEDYNLGPEYPRSSYRRDDECIACGHWYRDHDGFKGECTYESDEGRCFCCEFER